MDTVDDCVEEGMKLIPLNAGIDLTTGQPLEWEKFIVFNRATTNTYMQPEQVTTTERLDELFASFPIKSGDRMWLIGGCEGLQVEFFLNTYPGITVDVYEPQLVYVQYLLKKFAGYPVTIHPYALGDRTGDFVAGLQDTECTFHWDRLVDAGLMDKPTNLLPMEDIERELAREWFYPNFLMMNCEGSELEIIKKLSQLHILDGFPHILTQYHSRVLGIEGCQEACNILSRTHDIKWRYGEWAWVYAEVKE